MSGFTREMDDLRIALAEVDILSIVTSEVYDREDWVRPDSVLVERVASLLGLISKSASAAMAAFHRLHGAVADAAPAPAGESWDYEGCGTAPGSEEAVSARDDEHVNRDGEVVRRLRERCAAQLGRSIDYPFFRASYLDGEDPDAALLRLFQRNRQMLGRTDDDVIAAMVPFALVHEGPSNLGGGR